MAKKKLSPVGDRKGSKNPILESMNILFYISKVLGLIPYSLSSYITEKQLKLSQLGNVFCLLSCIHYTIHYHILNASTMLTRDSDASIGALTKVIGIFIIYLEPLMMAIDVLASLINQKSFVIIFDRLREIDDKLGKENVLLNYRVIKKYSIIFVVIAFIGEITLAFFNLIVFETDLYTWSSVWWLISAVPMFINGVAKTWFLILILLVQQRLRAINEYLNDAKRTFQERKTRQVDVTGSNLKKDNLFIGNIGYLEKEIFSTRNMKIKSDNAWNWVGNSITTNKVNDISIFAPKSKGFIEVSPYGNESGQKGEHLNLHLIDCHPKNRFLFNSISHNSCQPEIDIDGQFPRKRP